MSEQKINPAYLDLLVALISDDPERNAKAHLLLALCEADPYAELLTGLTGSEIADLVYEQALMQREFMNALEEMAGAYNRLYGSEGD